MSEETPPTLFGIEIEPLEENYLPTGILVIVKSVNMENGNQQISTRPSHGLQIWEAMGMLRMASLWADQDAMRGEDA